MSNLSESGGKKSTSKGKKKKAAPTSSGYGGTATQKANNVAARGRKMSPNQQAKKNKFSSGSSPLTQNRSNELSKVNSPPMQNGFFKKRGEKEKPIKEEISVEKMDKDFDGSGSFNQLASGSFNKPALTSGSGNDFDPLGWANQPQMNATPNFVPPKDKKMQMKAVVFP